MSCTFTGAPRRALTRRTGESNNERLAARGVRLHVEKLVQSMKGMCRQAVEKVVENVVYWRGRVIAGWP